MAKYLDPKSDLTFKRIFGEHPHLLLSFLNAIMPLEEGRIIEEIHYLSAEQVPDIVDKKNSIVDVKCIDNHKNQFIVEMQMYWSEIFKNRMLFNAGKAYVRQLNRNENYNLLKPVYTLAIINDIFDRETENFYHHYQIVNKENTNEIIKGLEFILVELPKFCPQSWEDRKLAALWLRFLSEVDEDMRTLPQELQENEDIRQAAELCEEAAFTPAELEAYDNYWDAVRIEKSLIDERDASLAEGKAKGRAKGRAEGEAIGLEKGEAIGIQKEKEQIVINAHKMGMSIENIATLTNLSPADITKILKQP